MNSFIKLVFLTLWQGVRIHSNIPWLKCKIFQEWRAKQAVVNFKYKSSCNETWVKIIVIAKDVSTSAFSVGFGVSDGLQCPYLTAHYKFRVAFCVLCVVEVCVAVPHHISYTIFNIQLLLLFTWNRSNPHSNIKTQFGEVWWTHLQLALDDKQDIRLIFGDRLLGPRRTTLRRRCLLHVGYMAEIKLFVEK